jgi:hypothetical protein
MPVKRPTHRCVRRPCIHDVLSSSSARLADQFPTGRKLRKNCVDNIPCLGASLRGHGGSADGMCDDGRRSGTDATVRIQGNQASLEESARVEVDEFTRRVEARRDRT